MSTNTRLWLERFADKYPIINRFIFNSCTKALYIFGSRTNHLCLEATPHSTSSSLSTAPPNLTICWLVVSWCYLLPPRQRMCECYLLKNYCTLARRLHIAIYRLMQLRSDWNDGMGCQAGIAKRWIYTHHHQFSPRMLCKLKEYFIPFLIPSICQTDSTNIIIVFGMPCYRNTRQKPHSCQLRF